MPPESERLPAGGVLDSPDPVGDEAEIEVMIVESAMCAKAAGNLPGSVQRLINELTKTKINFRDLLAEFLDKSMREDYSLRRPNRRYMSAGVYLPSLQSEATPEIAFFIDTSGSINEKQLTYAVSALKDCIAQVNPERVHVIACDTTVQWRKTFERGEELDVETPGGGGTYFAPPFDALEEDGIEPACAIYFTADACGHFGDAPAYPVLWITEPSASQTPWGQQVRVDEHGAVA